MDTQTKLVRSLRIWVLAISVLVSLLLVCNVISVNKDNGWGVGNGLSYGLDFVGGTEIWLKLEDTKNVTPQLLAVEKGILENRLNALGLKDIPVSIYGDQYIIVKVAKASPSDIEQIKNILKQQARFEQRIDGDLAVKGDEISVDMSAQGSRIYGSAQSIRWDVLIRFNEEGACRFGQVAQNKFFGQDNPKNRPVDMFIDRPEETTLLMTEALHGVLGNTSSTVSSRDSIYYGNNAIEVIENRSRIPVIILNEKDINKTLEEYAQYKEKGYAKTIIAEDAGKISELVRNLIADEGISVKRIPIGNSTPDSWIMNVTGLKSTPMLNFDTGGKCIYGASIGGGSSTVEEAKKEIQQNQIWLTSGNLPKKAVVDSTSTIPASLGAQFLRYSLLTGILGVLSVSLVIFLRYRKLFIVIPTIITGFSEIIIILGMAALIDWEIDLPAIAGIIAAVGTGVDNQIVITDETLASKAAASTRRTVSLTERIKRAFFIIFTSAATIVAVMLPLMFFVAGMIKGFALITILGVLIGVFITRPAYAKIIEELFKSKE